MALRYKFDNIGGSYKSTSWPVTIWDDTFADVSANAAVAFASGIAPPSIFGNLLNDDPAIEQLAGHVWRVVFNYTPPELSSPPTPAAREQGTLARRVSFQARSKEMRYFLEPIGVFDIEGDITDGWEHTKWFINAEAKGFEYVRIQGATIDPLPETRTLDYYAPNSLISDAYLNTVEALCGKFNDSTFLGMPHGSLQLVRFSASERGPNDWELSFGFGYQAPEFGKELDGIIIPELRGSWFHWARTLETLNEDAGATIEVKADQVFVGRVWDEDDFSILDLPSVTYPEGDE